MRFGAGRTPTSGSSASKDSIATFRRTGKLKLAAKPAQDDKLACSQELLAREVDPDTHMA
jgi:hypothetical protein